MDTGATMIKLHKLLEKFQPASVKVARWGGVGGWNYYSTFFFCSLLVKRTPRSCGYRPNCEHNRPCDPMHVT